MHKSGFGAEEAKQMFYYGAWFVSQVFWIFLITQTSHDTVEQSHEARRLIHNFVIEETFPEIEHELDLLVRHLEKHQFLFSANGFFTVDYRIFCMVRSGLQSILSVPNLNSRAKKIYTYIHINQCIFPISNVFPCILKSSLQL
uniref:Uncharacterized protein n=1 Tax=Cacopsylla melanoneura TaxID=428564 RepID=A0A8D9ABZ3_9HEMI